MSRWPTHYRFSFQAFGTTWLIYIESSLHIVNNHYRWPLTQELKKKFNLEVLYVVKVWRCFVFCRNYYDLKTVVCPSNLAYTGTKLGLHTDLPYIYGPPGVSKLHHSRVLKSLLTLGLLIAFRECEQLPGILNEGQHCLRQVTLFS